MRFNNLQVGRLVAALMVVVIHTVHYARRDLGLDVPAPHPLLDYVLADAVIFFFVLSGFVVTHSAQKASVARLVLVRLLRFYPTFWVAAGVVLAVRWAAGASFDVPAKYVLKGLTLWPVGPTQAVYPLGIEWTLIYEVWLLVGMVPLLLIGRRWGLGVGAAVWLAAIVVKEVVRPFTAFPQLPTLAEWPLAVPNAPFLMGALACLTYRRWATPGLGLPLAAAVPYALGAACYTTAPGTSYLLESLGTTLAVGWLAVVRQPAANHPLTVAGDGTYGIYLVHASVLMAFYSWARTSTTFPPSAATAVCGAVIAVTVGAAFGAAEYAAFLRARRWLFGLRPAEWWYRRRATRKASPASEPVSATAP